MKNSIPLLLIKFYQSFISPFLGQNCRYYPSCSSYAKWLYEKENFFKASAMICFRILRCNGLFIGGIEYPQVHRKIAKNNLIRKNMINPEFWLVPKSQSKFYLIKSIS